MHVGFAYMCVIQYFIIFIVDQKHFISQIEILPMLKFHYLRNLNVLPIGGVLDEQPTQ